MREIGVIVHKRLTNNAHTLLYQIDREMSPIPAIKEIAPEMTAAF
jgi:hypothetical protein